MIWLFVLETVADFVNASAISIRERTSETAHALTWLILNMYVPLLVVSLGLLVWQAVSRRDEDLFGAEAAEHRAGGALSGGRL